MAALLCLAIGTGANTAVFSVINGILLRPLPFDQPEQIVMIAVRWDNDQKAGPLSLEQFRNLGPAEDLFQQMAVRTFYPVGVASGGGRARMAQAEFVSGNYFQLLRLRPLAGRLFTPGSDRPGAEPVAVLSERLWRTRFQSDPSIAGKTVRVNGRPVVIAGVAPSGFVGAMQVIAADVWFPASLYASFASPRAPREAEAWRQFGFLARLKPGASMARTREQLQILLGNEWRARHGTGTAPEVKMEEAAGFGVPPGIRHIVVGGSAILFGLMALLLSIAIANVAGLMLARATGRRKEIAIRLAMGASPSRIVRQVLTESVILALAGTCLGILFAAALPSLLTILGPNLPEHLRMTLDVRPDWRSVVYAAISAMGIAMLFGLVPARQAARTNTDLALRPSAGNSRTAATSRTLNAFVTGQVAISTVLLVTAILFARTYLNTLAADPGIDVRNTLVAPIDWSQTGLDTENGTAFFDRLLSRVSAIPGVLKVALALQPPLSPGGANVTIVDDRSNTFTAGSNVVTPTYFETVRLPLLQGRNFDPAESGAHGVAIINETMARQLAPGGSPLGRTFFLKNRSGRRLEVIGVTRDTKYRSLSEGARALFYEPLAAPYPEQMTLLVRTGSDPRVFAETVRHQIESENPDFAEVAVTTLENLVQEAARPSRQRAAVLGAACATGLMLSAFGLFGVISYGVRQRFRELGIRLAVGARPADIGFMVFRHALRLVLTGFAVGLVLAVILARVIAASLFGVSAHDPATLLMVALLLAAVAAVAAYLPARWAMRVDPITSIRAE